MERAAVYIRVSTEEQTEYSPDAQLYAIRRYAEQNGIVIEERFIYRDEGFSGRTASKRPAFMRMIGTARQKPKPFDTILIHKFDRFARSREDSIVFKSLLRKECGIKVVSITEKMEDNKFAVIMESMLEAMGEYYSLNLSEEVKKGMLEKARRGELQTPAAFGYRMREGLLTPERDEAEVVRKIFDLYVNHNQNARQIARYVNTLGFKSKRGNSFDKRLVTYILRNPVYIGKLRWTPERNGTEGRAGGGSAMVIEGKHEAIIGAAIWEAANQKMKAGSKVGWAGLRSDSVSTHWLRGILRCGRCGAVLSYGKGHGSKNAAYRCGRYLHGGCSASQRITVPKLEKAVLETLGRDGGVLLKENYTKRMVGADSPGDDEKLITRQMEKLDRQLVKARELAVAGVDTVEEYREEKEKLLQQREVLLNSLQAVKEKAKGDRAYCQRNISGICDLLAATDIGLTEKNNALKEIVQKMVYDRETDTLAIYYYLTEP